VDKTVTPGGTVNWPPAATTEHPSEVMTALCPLVSPATQSEVTGTGVTDGDPGVMAVSSPGNG
jgi:hypothetical protein